MGPFQYETGEPEAKNSFAAMLEIVLIIVHYHQPKIAKLLIFFIFLVTANKLCCINMLKFQENLHMTQCQIL